MVEAFGLNQGHAKVYTPTRDERLRCDSGGRCRPASKEQLDNQHNGNNLQKRRLDRFEANGAFKFPHPSLADGRRNSATMVEAFGLNQGQAKVYTPTRDERLRCDSGGVVVR